MFDAGDPVARVDEDGSRRDGEEEEVEPTSAAQVDMCIIYWIEEALWKAFTLAGHVGTPARQRTDMDIDRLIQVKEEMELLTSTQLPLEYAQASHHAMCVSLLI